jgi:erythromycin esterase
VGIPLDNRRTFLQGAGATIILPGLAWAQTDPLQALLAAKAAPVGGIDAADNDFADLEPMGAAIGPARVVQLGEPSHGAGSAFAAKARIVKFLHQRHGFDVLIWESGLYDVAVAQAAMRDPTTDATAAARKGVFTLWSEAAEVKPLFEYIKASQSTLCPLEMSGFDMQVTADGTRERFAEDLRSFAGAFNDPDLRAQAGALADSAIAARQRLYAGQFADGAVLESLGVAVRGLRSLIVSRRAAVAAAHGSRETSFIDRCLENMHSDALLRAEVSRAPTTTPARESRRDAWNASNLRWLLAERYAGRKAVVWAHNVHVMNGYYAPGFRDIHLQAHPGDMKTTGVFQKQWLGENAYTLGMTAYMGEEGFAMGGPKTPITPAPIGSLEARLHALDHPFAFLDFRALRKERLLRGLPIRAPKFDINALSEPGQLYDGVFFIDRMAAATHD